MVEVQVKKIKLEGEKTLKSITKAQTERELYLQLQLGVLQSMRWWRCRGPPAALNAQKVAALVHPIRQYTQHLKERGCDVTQDERLQETLDRIGQAVQVALASGCVYGNINHLLAALDSLPEARLLKIVVKTHQQAI